MPPTPPIVIPLATFHVHRDDPLHELNTAQFGSVFHFFSLGPRAYCEWRCEHGLVRQYRSAWGPGDSVDAKALVEDLGRVTNNCACVINALSTIAKTRIRAAENAHE